MGRPRKNQRIDEDEDTDMYETAQSRSRQHDDREEPLDEFERDGFMAAPESPLWIDPLWWPEGQEMRWVAITVDAKAHSVNWSAKTQAGWTPYKRGTNKRIDEKFPVVPMPGGGPADDQNVIHGGLCLCQRDRRLGIRDKKMQQRRTQEAGRVIETYVEGGNANIPRFNDSGPTQYERGRAQFKE